MTDTRRTWQVLPQGLVSLEHPQMVIRPRQLAQLVDVGTAAEPNIVFAWPAALCALGDVVTDDFLHHFKQALEAFSIGHHPDLLARTIAAAKAAPEREKARRSAQAEERAVIRAREGTA